MGLGTRASCRRARASLALPNLSHLLMGPGQPGPPQPLTFIDGDPAPSPSLLSTGPWPAGPPIPHFYRRASPAPNPSLLLARPLTSIIPKSAKSRPKVDSKSAKSQPKVAQRSVQSRPKVISKSAKRRTQGGQSRPKAAPSQPPNRLEQQNLKK